MAAPHIQIVIGSTRERRFGASVAHWFADIAASREDMDSEVVDLADWRLPLVSSPVPPAMAPPQDPLLQRWAAKVAAADGYVLVTPEYNHGYPAVLKNALDVVFTPWNRKPVSFVSYGSAGGGLRAVEQLRLVSIELEMVPLRQQVAIPRVYAALDDSGRPRDAHHADDARRVLDEMAWWSAALRVARDRLQVPA
ncbi:MAG: hypothetical protein AVDCRST_MAG69-1243 [uncultured Solirubrobacteraceae bacterium]|uniref:NADPH-dependent FMN reductase-like domain-containing protein n=1 Tax=uncultured Solirubrobacteraceae bacterium TaxID=1162706 RepID=A0A6J4S4I2_9ACTN|nr:MAG: hypothetical protein AVDCRST_MAG69-1243 [uncultured Solirubrobacteraceae bacterium]